MTQDFAIDYYAALGISSTATAQQVRDAYKKAALKTHPDRVSVDSPDRPARTRKFQLINEAYYTLSDPRRRREYDQARKPYGFGTGASTASTAYGSDEDESIPDPGPNASTPGSFPWSNFGFGQNHEQGQRTQNDQFGDVFEEMLREEGMAGDGGRPTSLFWSVVGGLSGGAMGFIVANFPGMVAGAVAGNRLGAVRDAKGKSVYAVFNELPQSDKARLLSQLAQKVFSHAVGGS